MQPERLTQILDRLPMPDALTAPPANAPKTSSFEAGYLRQGFPLRHVRHEPAFVHGSPSMETLERLRKCLQSPKGSICVLWGIRGTGKTQLAISAAMEVETPATQRYVKASDIFREIRSSFRKESKISEVEVFATFLKPWLLIIDEAQERGETEFEDRTLTHLLDKRYDALLHTMIISNQTKEELSKSLGTSIVSRAHECGEVIECNWASFRKQVKP